MLHRVIEVGNVELLQQTCEYFGTGDVRACKTGTERNRTPVYTKPDGRVVVIFDKAFQPSMSDSANPHALKVYGETVLCQTSSSLPVLKRA
jgi:hypothetical protein